MTTNGSGIFRDSGLQKVEDDYLEMPNVTTLSNFASNSSLRKIILNIPKVTDAINLFSAIPQLQYAEIINSIENINNFSNIIYNTYSLATLRLNRWKQGNLPLSPSLKLTAESIHYIIQNAVDVADGVTARTLTLSATARKNWQNSEYYEQDLAVLEQKGITIA